MYKIYKTVRGKLTNPKKPQPGCWIDIQSPTEEDLNDLKPFLEIPEEVLISVKDTDEVPKVEEEEKFQFIVIQTPLNQTDSSLGEYAVVPLGILYNRDYIITISNGKNDVMNYLRQKLKNFDNNKIINTEKKTTHHNDTHAFLLKNIPALPKSHKFRNNKRTKPT